MTGRGQPAGNARRRPDAVAGTAEHRDAFDRLTELLHAAAATSARALDAHRGMPAGDAVERQLEHTLDRLAMLHGRGTYENLSTAEIFEAAIGLEMALAHELDGPDAAAADARARALADAARRGVRLHVRPGRGALTPHRGVYGQTLRPALEEWLEATDEPYMRRRDGALVVLSE